MAMATITIAMSTKAAATIPMIMAAENKQEEMYNDKKKRSLSRRIYQSLADEGVNRV